MCAGNWKDKEFKRDYHRRYYLANKAKFNARSRAYAKAHPDRMVAAARKWKFGLTPQQQAELLSKPCAICGKKATHIDHDHATGEIRGGLCNNCNTGLGMFQDDIGRIANAIKYLTK